VRVDRAADPHRKLRERARAKLTLGVGADDRGRADVRAHMPVRHDSEHRGLPGTATARPAAPVDLQGQTVRVPEGLLAHLIPESLQFFGLPGAQPLLERGVGFAPGVLIVREACRVVAQRQRLRQDFGFVRYVAEHELVYVRPYRRSTSTDENGYEPDGFVRELIIILGRLIFAKFIRGRG